jgi:hypothetical protein
MIAYWKDSGRELNQVVIRREKDGHSGIKFTNGKLMLEVTIT